MFEKYKIKKSVNNFVSYTFPYFYRKNHNKTNGCIYYYILLNQDLQASFLSLLLLTVFLYIKIKLVFLYGFLKNYKPTTVI